MDYPIIVLPAWIKSRLDIHSLSANNIESIKKSISDDELLWILSLHKLPEFGTILTPLSQLCQSPRVTRLLEYELDVETMLHYCTKYLRLESDANLSLELELVTNINLHVMTISYTPDVTRHVHELAKLFCDNTSFTQMSKAANGELLQKYLN